MHFFSQNRYTQVNQQLKASIFVNSNVNFSDSSYVTYHNYTKAFFNAFNEHRYSAFGKHLKGRVPTLNDQISNVNKYKLRKSGMPDL